MTTIAKKAYEVIAGSTIKLTWINSGVTPDAITCALRDRSDTIIGSGTVASSGNGQYYCVMRHPGSSQWVVNEWIATISANTYISRQFGQVVGMEAD